MAATVYKICEYEKGVAGHRKLIAECAEIADNFIKNDKITTDMPAKNSISVFFCRFVPMKSICAQTCSRLYSKVANCFAIIFQTRHALEKGGFQVEKVRYMISDAANVVQVESHVLRYWEDELELDVPRNELGHRYYTQENIDEFLRIKELKERGYQLKAIRLILQDEKERGKECAMEPAIRIEKVDGMEIGEEVIKKAMAKNEIIHVAQKTNPLTDEMQRERRMEQFQSMMTEIVRKAISENNERLGQEVGTQVGEQVIKEMNYLMRTQDEQEEERFRKLDEAIRSMGRGSRREKKRLSRKERKLLKDKNEMVPDLTV